MRTKAEELSALVTAARALRATDRSLESATASLYIEGMALAAYGALAYDMSAPRGLTDEDLTLYKDMLATAVVFPADDKAEDRLLLALGVAHAAGR